MTSVASRINWTDLQHVKTMYARIAGASVQSLDSRCLRSSESQDSAESSIMLKQLALPSIIRGCSRNREVLLPLMLFMRALTASLLLPPSGFAHPANLQQVEKDL
jgi:hypothetical protein